MRGMALSNKELGERIGVSHSMASRIRNGKRLPGTRTLDAIHRELDIPLSDLHEAHREGAPAFGRLIADRLHRGPTPGASDTRTLTAA